MFYIDKTRFVKWREKIFLHILPTLTVFAAFLLLSSISWKVAVDAVKDERTQALTRNTNESLSSINQRMDSYEDILRGAAGLFNASTEVTRQEWGRYLKTYDIGMRYPGIQGIGYVKAIPASDLTAHEQAVREEGFPDYSVFPKGDRPFYASVVYIEPFSGQNLRAWLRYV